MGQEPPPKRKIWSGHDHGCRRLWGPSRRVWAGMLALAGVAACSGLVIGPAGAAPLTTSTGLACGAKSSRLLFWPQGHPAIPSVGFGNYPIPHLELYAGTGGSYPDGQLAVFLDAAGHASTTTLCTLVPIQLGSIPANRRVEVTHPVKLTCKTSKAPTVDVVPTPAILELTVKKQAVASVFLSGSPTLRYDKKFCKPSPSPS